MKLFNKTKIQSFEEYHRKLKLYNQFFGVFEDDNEDTSVEKYSNFGTLTKEYLSTKEETELFELLAELELQLLRDLREFTNHHK